jgi:hypothetical protein
MGNSTWFPFCVAGHEPRARHGQTSITQQVFGRSDELFEYPERSMIGVYGKYL